MGKRGFAPSQRMSSKDPTDARAAFLKTLPPEEQVQVLLRAEKQGPYANDPDWILALAVGKAVDRIEAAVTSYETKIKDRVKGGDRQVGSVNPNNTIRLVLWSVATSLALFVGIVEFALRFSSAHLQEVAVYSAALAIGVAGSALYAGIAPYLIRRSNRRR